jgi:hypothetical protein
MHQKSRIENVFLAAASASVGSPAADGEGREDFNIGFSERVP